MVRSIKFYSLFADFIRSIKRKIHVAQNCTKEVNDDREERKREGFMTCD